MLFKGTVKRTTSMLKEAIEGIGGSFNGFTSEDSTCYFVKLPHNYLELGLDILSDMVRNPLLDAGELEKEKYVISEEIKMYMDQPAHHVFDLLSEAMWPKHPLGRPIAGYLGTVKKFTRASLGDFMKRFYENANITVVATGKVEMPRVAKFIKKVFRENSPAKK